jgi:hypothetical protein
VTEIHFIVLKDKGQRGERERKEDERERERERWRALEEGGKEDPG